MPRYVAIWTFGGVSWQDTSRIGGHDENVIEFYFNDFQRSSDKRILLSFSQMLSNGSIDWLSNNNGKWIFDAETFRKSPENFPVPEWLIGKTEVDLEIIPFTKEVFGKREERSRIHISVERRFVNNMRRKIFLSHKSADKPLVEKVHKILRTLGLEPWLDSEEMVAGINPDRGISKGFEDSCAVVFFISNNFVDERYLAGEIDYAMREKRKHGDGFNIITLVINKQNGESPKIPDLLKTYIYKDISDVSDGILEIIRALPVKIGVVGEK